MKTAEEIAQWAINNRYPKSENNKVSDAEMYNTLVDSIKEYAEQYKRTQQAPCEFCSGYKQGINPHSFCLSCGRMVEL